MAIAETPVRLPIPPLPKGFRAAGTHAGLKRNPNREDISLIVSDPVSYTHLTLPTIYSV